MTRANFSRKRGVNCKPKICDIDQKLSATKRINEKIFTNNNGTPAVIDPKNKYNKTFNLQTRTK